MEEIDTITVRHRGQDRHVSLYVGDLAAIPVAEAIDLLIVSAFPDDYTPTRTSLIGALSRAGISVAALAKTKEVDLRQFSSCWLSHEISQPGANFRRLLCFEPSYRGRAPEVVGDIFRSIVPFTSGNPAISQIAMPVVASGNQGENAHVMLDALADAALHWLSVGLPVDRIKIVLQRGNDFPTLCETFNQVKLRHAAELESMERPKFQYDVFVSYAHKDKATVDNLISKVSAARPSLRIFVDRLELHTGAAWQQHIFEALDASRKVICGFSPNYVASKVCKEEYNIAHFRHRESDDGVLLPVYLFTAELPTYMKLVQHHDMREGDPTKVSRHGPEPGGSDIITAIDVNAARGKTGRDSSNKGWPWDIRRHTRMTKTKTKKSRSIRMTTMWSRR